MATYTCNDGYKANGTITRRCGRGGQWSASALDCIGELIEFRLEEISENPVHSVLSSTCPILI